MPERDTEKKKRNPLEEALENFMEVLPDMLTLYEGKFVAFGPDSKEPVGGYWHCEEDAKLSAYREMGPNYPFIVMPVSRDLLNDENLLAVRGIVSFEPAPLTQ